MSQKRTDRKGRLLRTGESQRPDGRYAYKYTDAAGKQQFVYAWKLVATDKTPANKRDDISLREKIQQIQQDLHDGIDPTGKQITVFQLYEKYKQLHGNVKQGTKESRKQLTNILAQDKLGACSIERVKLSDAKEWAQRMQEKGYAYQTIKNHKRSLSAAFHLAVQDDYIRKNPFHFSIGDVLTDDTEPKEALTQEQQKSLLSFVQSSKIYRKYYDAIVILLGTGLRISELCGLTVTNLDFFNRMITVDHQLLKSDEIGVYAGDPKYKSSFRQIPMGEDVYHAFLRVVNARKGAKAVIVGGYTNFLFLNRNGQPMVSRNYQQAFRNLVRQYNQDCKIPLPEVMTPHTLRHTFCTNMANANMNPKALQYIMGHSKITMTLDYYAHADGASAKAEFERLAV